jgi:hypothetical protein
LYFIKNYYHTLLLHLVDVDNAHSTGDGKIASWHASASQADLNGVLGIDEAVARDYLRQGRIADPRAQNSLKSGFRYPKALCLPDVETRPIVRWKF